MTPMESSHQRNKGESIQENKSVVVPGMKWGADQGMLLRVHEIMVLSALEYGSAAHGSASNAQIKRLEPVHNKALRIALGAFCVCRTRNIMCESGFESLAESRKRKIIKTAIHVATWKT
jgi:hypothetical protein